MGRPCRGARLHPVAPRLGSVMTLRGRVGQRRITRLRRGTREAPVLSHLAEIAPVGMAVTGPDGLVRYINPAFTRLLGHRLVPGQDLDIIDLIHVDDDKAGRQQLERLMRGEIDIYRGEHRLSHADGQPVWGMLAAAMSFDADGEPDSIVVQATSIELQKRAEEALAHSESRWNFALESARQGVWDHDIRTDSMFYSRMWRVMRGIPPDEEVDGDQLKWIDRIHPDDRQHVLENVDRQDQGDADLDALEYRERRRDGSYVWILSRGKPVEWDDNGNAVRTLGTDTDITRLKTIELELAAEKERLRVTLDAIADGMISTDETGHVVFMNPAAEALTGTAIDQALGRPVQEIFVLRDGSTGEVQNCPVALCLGENEAVHRDDDIVLVDPSGFERDIRCTASPV